MSGVFFDYDPLSGAVETFDYDEETETAIIRRSCDVQPVIDRNKALDNHVGHQRGADGELAASIPVDVAYLWLNRYGVKAWEKDHWPAVRRLLNDGEWRYLRCNSLIL